MQKVYIGARFVTAELDKLGLGYNILYEDECAGWLSTDIFERVFREITPAEVNLLGFAFGKQREG